MVRVLIGASVFFMAATSMTMHKMRMRELENYESVEAISHDLIARAYDDDDAYDKLIEAISVGLVHRSLLNTIDAEKLFALQNDDDIDEFSATERVAFATIFPINTTFMRFIEEIKKLNVDGDTDATFILAYCYEFGRGVPRDLLRAYALYTQAVLKDHVRAHGRLALYFLFDTEHKQDHLTSLLLANMGSLGNDALALFILATQYRFGVGVEHDFLLAINYFKRAARLHHGDSYNSLGVMAYLGHGMKIDYQVAANYFSLAANLGVPQAMTNLAYMYEHGRGVDKDMITADYWYRRASLCGDQAAYKKINSSIKNPRAIWIQFYFPKQESWRPVEATLKSF